MSGCNFLKYLFPPKMWAIDYLFQYPIDSDYKHQTCNVLNYHLDMEAKLV
jgi:hypothetical protein